MATLPKGQGVIPLPPFKAWLASNIPAVYDNTMTYYEELCALLKYLQDQVVPALNANASAITVLSNYVENYFNNLDVQEEINNKLDEMAEDGTLQEIITSYIQANVAWTFDTVADMKQSTNLVDGSYARTLGFHSINDGGGATYYITDTGTANEMDIIAVGDLYANLIYTADNSIKHYGAIADGTTDNTPFIERMITLGKTSIFIPDGTYLVNSVIDLGATYELSGQSVSNTIILAPNGFLTWDSSNKNKKSVHDITIDGVTKTASNVGIEAPFAFCKLSNIVIKNYYIGIKPLAGTWINEFNNIDFEYCTNGFYNAGISDVNNNNFYSCIWQHISNECVRIKGNVNNFNGCNLELSHICFAGRLGRNIKVDECYIENNDIVFNIDEASYTSGITVSNSWLIPTSTDLASGWLATLFTVSSVDNTTSPLIIERCYIDNKTKDTVKPFAFNSNGTKSYWGVSLLENSYTNVKTSNQYLIYYDDLFDLTNCPQYACPTNPVTFKTDLPLYTENGIVWFQDSQGNMLGYAKTNNKIKMVGRYSVTKTAGSITINPSKLYGCYYPTINCLPVVVHFTDDTYAITHMDITSSSFSITSIPYNGRTTAEIIFNNEYGNMI